MSKTKVEALNALCEKLGKTSTANTTVEALKNIYNALSGETSNAELISTAIDDITTVAEKPTPPAVVGWTNATVSKEVTSVNIPEGVTIIAYASFENCTSLESITIPDSVTSIENSAFDGCSSLTSIWIPDGVTQISAYLLCLCTSLKSIVIPDSVTSIKPHAFEGCSSLAKIYYKGTEEQWNAITKDSDWNKNMGSNVEGGTVINYNFVG